MTTKASAPAVVGKVDEETGTVSVGVVHEGQFLPVASKSLDGARARGLNAEGEPEATDESEGEG